MVEIKDTRIGSRQSNFEFLRICCMLMIVAGHLVMYHKIPFSITSSEEILKLFCMSFFSVAVNAFILISGYFGIDFKMDRFLRLILQVFFYSVLAMLLSSAFGWHVFNIKRDLFAFFPVLTKQYWFVTCYVVLYLISPWLNIWIDSLEKKQYKILLLVGFLIVYVWPTISFLFNAPRFIDDGGYGIVNFVYLYMLGRYLSIYFKGNDSSSFYLFCYLITAVSLFICQFVLSWVLGFEFTSWFSYNTIFVLLGAISLFLAFREMDFSSRFVNILAKPCLAVYLIHMNHYTWPAFCDAIGVNEIHGAAYILTIFFMPILIYFICALAEICRLKAMSGFENTLISFFYKKK